MRSNSQEDISVLGIDPGLATTGWGIIKTQNSALKALDWGIIKTPQQQNLGTRLGLIYQEINQLIKDHRPSLIAIEKLFFGKNVKTAMSVGEARGVIILACENSNIKWVAFAPLEIKIATCGYGQARKQQVQKVIKQLLKLQEIPRPDDAADALAIAYTAIVRAKFTMRTERGT